MIIKILFCSDSNPSFFGFLERAIEYKVQPFLRFSGVTVYLIGFKNCPSTYIHEVCQDTTFDTNNPEVLIYLTVLNVVGEL